jgi:D-threo-aldose 1-dehydrogenase
MEKIVFKDIITSSLGFGCTQLTDSTSRNAAIQTLHTAFEAGITHFDTARLYGFGESEAILGQFVKDKRDKITITTKIGLDPVAVPTGSMFLLKLAKSVVNSLPAVKKLIVKKTDGFVNVPTLTPEKAAQHIDEALQKLKTDYIDILLLHEFDVATANQPALVDFFQSKIKEGKIRHVGLGTAFKTIKNQASALNATYDVVQIEHNLLNPNINQLHLAHSETTLTNAHSIFKDIKYLKKCFADNKKLTTDLEKEVGVRFSDVQNISNMLLDVNKYTNPLGINIFTSATIKNIQKNVAEWEKPSFSPEQVAIFSKHLHNSLQP